LFHGNPGIMKAFGKRGKVVADYLRQGVHLENRQK